MRTNLFTLAVFIAFFLSSGCSQDNQTGLPPVITYVSPDSAMMGDTVIIEGRNFNPIIGENMVAFSPGLFSANSIDMYAVPFAGSKNLLRASVPDGAFTGNIRVERVNPLSKGYPLSYGEVVIQAVPVPFTVGMKRGDVAKAFFNSERSDFELRTGGTKRHLMIIFTGNVPSDTSTTYTYNVGFDGVTVASRPAYGKQGPAGRIDRQSVRARFEKRRRDDFRHLLRTVTPCKKQGAKRLYGSLAGASHSPAAVELDVFANTDGQSTIGETLDPDEFTKVQADLKYEGDHTLVYLDTSTDGGCIDEAEIVNLGEAFDMGIYDTDRNYYGVESDINSDEKIAILLSPVVNRLTPEGTAEDYGYLAGFFLSGDLLPSLVHEDCTNGMEIFYTMVPDPTGLYGNVFEKQKALESIEGILAHEFVHMIMFNYRFLQYGNGILANYIEDTWLEEGLAHIAEGLNGYHNDNIKRANRFLRNPADFSLIYGKDGLAERGAAFLFLRYLGDRYDDSIFRDMAQSRSSGTYNIEVVTGESFIDLYAEWAAALYLSGRGISADARFNYGSIDLQADFDELRVNQYDMISPPFSGEVKSMASEFIVVELPVESSHSVTLESGSEGRMNAVIVRLD